MKETQFIPKIITIFREGYRREDLSRDLLSGLTVAVIALPLAMALAIASGASPERGLTTAVIAGFLISLLGGSRVQIGGPTGAFVVVVYHIISRHGYDGLLLTTFIAGMILVVAGYAKLGQVIKYLPLPVVTGFTTGIAVIIASSQVKDFLGLSLDKAPGDFILQWIAYSQRLETASGSSMMVGFFTLSVILSLRFLAPKWPSYLTAILLSSLLVVLFQLPVETIGTRFPSLPSGLPLPSLPDFSWGKAKDVLPSAFTVAFLAGIEALLSAMVADGMSGYKHRSNQELVGQGFANIASSLFGGLPATGAIARTATNIKSGGRTPFAGIFHALFLLLFTMTASGLMKFVPMATLAAVLFMVAWGMSEIRPFLRTLTLASHDRWVMILTFLLTLFVDLTVAIGIGVTLASLLFMLQMSKSVEITSHRRRAMDLSEEGAEESQREALPDGVEVFQIRGPVFFGIAGELMDILKRTGGIPKVLILRMRYVPFLDGTGFKMLEQMVKTCHQKGTKIIFSGLQSQPQKLLSSFLKTGFGESVLFCESYEEALHAAARLSSL